MRYWILTLAGQLLVMLAGLIGWEAFGWRNLLLICAATFGACCWCAGLWGYRRGRDEEGL